jgi:LacI family transcriptional regulator
MATDMNNDSMRRKIREVLDTGAGLCCSVGERGSGIQEPRSKASPVAVTIREVAKASGFSPSTVSIVLNDAPLARYIPETTKKRIQQAAKYLGYRPNLFARTLRNQRTHTIGVMVFDMTDPYCTPILRGIENALYEASFLPIVSDVQNQRSRFERYLEMLLDRRIEGLIIIANWLFIDIDVLADLGNKNIPTVMIGHELRRGSISSVTVDNELGGRTAIEHLCSLGHRRIAFLRGPRQITDTAPRWKGVLSFAKAHKLQIDPKLVRHLPESGDPLSSFDAGCALTEDLLQAGRPFSALMAFDDVTAFGAIRALHKHQIRIPDQCSVIGFDDIAHAKLLTPSLTTMQQPMADMGRTAVNIVAEAIGAARQNGKGPATHRKLIPKLVIRESTGPCCQD